MKARPDENNLEVKLEQLSPGRRLSLRRGSLSTAGSAGVAPRKKSYSLPEGRIVAQSQQTPLVESKEDFEQETPTSWVTYADRRNKGKSDASQKTIEKRVSATSHVHIWKRSLSGGEWLYPQKL